MYNNSDGETIGYCVDLLKEIQAKTNIKFKIKFVEDGNYGSNRTSADGSWNGMIGELLTKV